MFVCGMFINIHSDAILRSLRAPGDNGYKIPYGGLFEYVSGANYFGECLEWAGYAIFAYTLPAMAFAIFTICNVGPRALHHHRYANYNFRNYLKSYPHLWETPFIQRRRKVIKVVLGEV